MLVAAAVQALVLMVISAALARRRRTIGRAIHCLEPAHRDSGNRCSLDGPALRSATVGCRGWPLLSMRMEPVVLEKLRTSGKGLQTNVNVLLREAVKQCRI